MTSSLTAWIAADPYDELVSVQTSCDAIWASDVGLVADLGMVRSTTAVLLPGRICTGWPGTGAAAGGNADSAAPLSQPAGLTSSARTRSAAGSDELTGTKTGSGTRSLPLPSGSR